jgi:hypothetical protein
MASHDLSLHDYRHKVLQYGSKRVAKPPTSQDIASSTAIWTKIGGLNEEITTLTKKCRVQRDDNQKLKLFTELLDKYYSHIIESQRFANLTHQELSPNIPRQLWSKCISPCLDFLRQCEQLPSNSLGFFLQAASTLLELLDKAPESNVPLTTCSGHLFSTGGFIDNPNRHKYLDTGRFWYLTASDIAPADGDIYCYLAGNATNVLQKHLHCSQAVCTVKGSPLAQKLLMKLFQTDWQATFPHASPHMFTFAQSPRPYLCKQNYRGITAYSRIP